MFSEFLSVGINELASLQQKDGSFLSLSSVDPRDFTYHKIFHTTFTTSLILTCIGDIPETSTLKRVKRNAAKFLLSQKSEDWSFNYWVKSSKEAEKMPYPDDLDDTFCALTALYTYDQHLFTGATFAKIITLLTTVEEKEGGPYKTWLVSKNVPAIWHDTDIAVNSNIAYFLALQDIELPNITSFIEQAIQHNTLSSPYYNGEIPLLYFISRWYKGKLRKNLIRRLQQLQKQKRVTENQLLHAFVILALLNFTVPYQNLTDSITNLINRKKAHTWEPYGFSIDPVIEGKKHYGGSKALTAAFCLLAISSYIKTAENQTKQKRISQISCDEGKMDAAVVSAVVQRFAHIDRNLQSNAKKIINDMLKTDIGKQVTLLPFITTASFPQGINKVPDTVLISLGCASLYGWIAYTIYDNFLDDEGDPKTISVATVALRELTLIFNNSFQNTTEFLDLFRTTMDRIDKANLWELNNCRFPVKKSIELGSIHIPEYGNYKYLAHRSMGHALASVAVLFYVGYTKESSEVKLLLTFFYHYIIARQLNDDAHDFEEDLRKGHINAVGADLLRVMKQQYKNNLPSQFSHILRLAHKIFWQETVVSISKDILKHAAKGRKAIEENTIIEKKEVFLSLLDSVEVSAHKALNEHANVIGFLHAYK